MRLGAMNDPRRPVCDEIRTIAADDFAFVDLTLEPPGAQPGALPLLEMARTLRETGLTVIGHTPGCLPIASPYPELRTAAREVVVQCMEGFAALGARLVTVHPDPGTPSLSPADCLALNAEAIAELDRHAQSLEIQIAVENIPGVFNEVAALRPLIESSPHVGFRLDLAHAAMEPQPVDALAASDRTGALLRAFADRLRHVDVSDTHRTGNDLHLPIGAGRIPWEVEVRRLQALYDGTITVEVHAQERAYVRTSAEIVRRLWSGG